MGMTKSSGILMPIFSLPSPYGIGDFGESGYNFVDFLYASGQKFWQILPLVQTGYGNSPYSSVCSYSLNPYFISPDILLKEGLLTQNETDECVYSGNSVNYEFLYNTRFPLLKKAFSRFNERNEDFKLFSEKKEFYNYALFMSLKEHFNGKDFIFWEDDYKYSNSSAITSFAEEHVNDVRFWLFVQYQAKKQWLNLKDYANSKGISIIGDMPLYVALDSVDVWENKSLFKLNSDFSPKKVAGVPPDYFCSDGQLWGNPVYDYSEQEKDGFAWWCERLKKALDIYDYVRIDHFRGLERFYEVQPDAVNAREGEWVNVPSKALFNALHDKVNKKRIIAEDLGIIDDGVRKLLKFTGYPGMKILSFAFNGEQDNLYLPEVLPYNCLCYTGTHDNDTLMGLIKSVGEWDRNNLYSGVKNSLEKMHIKKSVDNDSELCDAIVELGFKSKAKLFIMPMQDVLKKDGSFRINEPGTVKERNWAVRFSENDFNFALANRLKKLTVKYNRFQL